MQQVRLAQQVHAAGRAGGRGRGAAPVPLEFPLTLKAGPKLIGVAFVQRTEARDEATLRPRMRSRGTQPAINSVTISGPYNVSGAGDSPSRRRIFVCRPAVRSRRELPCARARILSTLARRAYRRPVERDGRPGPAAVLTSEAAPRAASTSAFRRRSSGCWSARSSCSASSVSLRRVSGAARRIASAISSSPRACRSSSGAASRTTSCSTRQRPGG